MQKAIYEVVENCPERITLKDIGHDRGCLTITNDVEGVVESVVPILGGRRLFYIDSDGNTDELLVENGKFAGFRPGDGHV